MKAIEEQYRKFLQTLLLEFLGSESEEFEISINEVQEKMRLSKEDAQCLFNIFNKTCTFLDSIKQHQSSSFQLKRSIELTKDELAVFSDFSLISSKMPLIDRDFSSNPTLTRLKQNFPFLFRFKDGKWNASIIGQDIGQEYKSLVKLNSLPNEIELKNLYIALK